MVVGVGVTFWCCSSPFCVKCWQELRRSPCKRGAEGHSERVSHLSAWTASLGLLDLENAPSGLAFLLFAYEWLSEQLPRVVVKKGLKQTASGTAVDLL